MKISIIIPVKPGGYVAAIDPLLHLDADSPCYEVIVAEGNRPSRQRNKAAATARGDILYFLDDDAVVPSDALKRIAAAFTATEVVVVGGPSITPADDTIFQRAIAYALSSTFGGGGIRNRYRRIGMLRETDDSELILCNLAFRKDVYLVHGGLDERLYPNEENELIDRLIASGARLLHDPDMYVTRSQRPDYNAFIRQMLTYGRGRAEQSLLTRSISIKAIIPVFFVLYLLTLPFSAFFWYSMPAIVYLLALLVNMLLAAGREEKGLVMRLPAIYFLIHFCYGIGFLIGAIKPRYKSYLDNTDAVMMRRITETGSGW